LQTTKQEEIYVGSDDAGRKSMGSFVSGTENYDGNNKFTLEL